MLKKIKEIIFKPFKRITLTFKITLWYTIFIVILLTSIILGTFFVSDSVVESSGKKKLIEELLKSKKEITYLKIQKSNGQS